MFNGYFSIDSKDRTEENSSAVRSSYPLLNVDFRDIHGIAVDKYDITLTIPTINTANDNFAVSDGVTSYPLSIPIEYYNLADLIVALETALNTSPIAPFNVTLLNDVITVQNIGTPFYFVKVGKSDVAGMLNIAYNNTLLNEQLGYPSTLSYTPYVDIISDNLHAYQSLKDGDSNNVTSNILTRVYITNDSTGSVRITNENTNLKWIDVTQASSTSPLSIRLVDCNGDDLPVDPVNDATKYSLLMITK